MTKRILGLLARGLSHVDKLVSLSRTYNHNTSVIKNFIDVGFIILSRKRWQLTNLFIPGHWKHAAICCVDTNYVVEAVGDGVKKTGFSDFLSKSSEFIILRPLFCDEHERKLAALWAERQVGKPYDYGFGSCNTELYCIELIAHAYSFARGGYAVHSRLLFGNLFFIPDGPSRDQAMWSSVYYGKS